MSKTTIFTQANYLERVQSLCKSKAKAQAAQAETAQAAKAESESKRKFADVMQAYCNTFIACNGNASDVVLGASLETLSQAVAFSVLRKCIDTSGDKMLFAMRGELSSDIKAKNYIIFADENAFKVYYNADGDYKKETVDSDTKTRLDELTAQTIGDGYDLAQVASLYIWKYSKQLLDYALYPQAVNNESKCFLEVNFPERRLKKKVYIKSEKSINGFETVLTCAITESFKAVRREIIAHKNAVDNGSYLYIDESIVDGESGAVETIYRRFHKYACITGALSFDGESDYLPRESKPQNIATVDRQIAVDLDNIIQELNLTARQMKVLEKRLAGYGYKAIATYLGVTHNAIINTLKRIQKRLLASGYKPPKAIIIDESAQAAPTYETAAAAKAAAENAAANAAKALAYCKACTKERLAIGFYELYKRFKETAAQAAAAAIILSARESVKSAKADAENVKAAAERVQAAAAKIDLKAAAAENAKAQAAAKAAAQAKAAAAKAQAKAAAQAAAAAQAKAAKAAERVQAANFYKKAAQAAAAQAKAAESAQAAAAFNATAAEYMLIYYRIAN
jgi:DNA-binding CsgD family transcriptional regulator